MTRLGEHAVVLGASMAGLMTARVLTEFYDRVTVVERDVLGEGTSPRRGVPQSRQPHVVLARCTKVLEELFPGIGDELVAGGAHEWCDGDLSRIHTRLGGHLVVGSGHIPNPAALNMFYASRPFIEGHVRRRVRALPQVSITDGYDIDSLTVDAGAVTGVQITSRADGMSRRVGADLVVDATGRGSRTPAFLEKMGYPRPHEDQLTVDVSYVSMPLRIPDGTLHEYLFIDLFAPGRTRGFALSRSENDEWLLLIGSLGHDVAPPASAAEVLTHAQQLMPAHAFAAVRDAEPLGDIALHRFPASRWRRYDKMDRMPDGLLVTGDAVCSFNPIYGQGMTIASVDAMAMRDCLRRGTRDLPRRFHRAAAKGIKVAWRTAVGSDLALPEVEGPRTMSTKVSNAFLDRVLQVTETDPWAAQELQMVIGMLAPPARLFRPAMLRRLVGARAGRTPTPVYAAATA